MEYCKCGSTINGICTNKRCPEVNNKLNRWVIDGVEYKFKETVTKSEAEEAVNTKSLIVIRSKGNPYIQRTIIN